MTKRLLKRKIIQVVGQIVNKFNPEKIILFGSAAWGDFTNDSDLDLLIIKSKVPRREIDRQYMIDRLIERNGIALDLLVYKPEEVDERIKLGDHFMAEIIDKGRVVYG